MSAGSKCLENMIAGRLQDIMVILRNQCNNKANLLVTLDSASHSLLREYTYVLKGIGIVYITITPRAAWGHPTGRQDRKEVFVVLSQRSCFSGRKIQGNFEMSAGLQCFEIMIAGRPQEGIVMVRNQCKNEENLVVTHDLKFWSQPFSFEGVHILS